MNPIYVSCHTCHARPGQPCRWGKDKNHDMRIRLAARTKDDIAASHDGIRVIHALAHGASCSDQGFGICTVCQQTISRLQNIPQIT